MPNRTVYTGEKFVLRVDEGAGGQPPSRLGSGSWRPWASMWNRLSAHPLDGAHDKYEMVLDANLRQIGAWSAVLQYIEDFREAFVR